MVAIKTLDGRRRLKGRGDPPKAGGSRGPRGGTGSRNSPNKILENLMMKQLELKKLISDARKKVKASKKTKRRA